MNGLQSYNHPQTRLYIHHPQHIEIRLVNIRHFKAMVETYSYLFDVYPEVNKIEYFNLFDVLVSFNRDGLLI